jgi:hypothetical protein
MKKFLWACVLALPLAAVSQQTASAGGFEINWGGGFNFHYTYGISWHHGGKDKCSHKSHECGHVPDCCDSGSSWGGYSGYCMDGFNSQGYSYAALPVMAQPAVQAMPQPTGTYGFQPVGYEGVPPYWYGR